MVFVAGRKRGNVMPMGGASLVSSICLCPTAARHRLSLRKAANCAVAVQLKLSATA
jgi:hypothetical protein